MAKNGPYTEDKYQFKFNFINQVPPGVALITKNTLTGEVKNVGDAKSGVSNLLGMKAIMTTWFPWIQTKYVTILPKTIDYKEFAYDTKDRIRLTVDLACEVRITDPAKFEYSTLTINKQLKTTIDDAVRRVMLTNDVDTIMDKSFDLYNEIKPDLDAFKAEYGLEISKLRVQNIKLPEGTRRGYEQKLTAAAEAQSIKEKVKAENEGQLEVIEKAIKLMKDNGLSEEQIANIVSGAMANMFLDMPGMRGHVSVNTGSDKPKSK